MKITAENIKERINDINEGRTNVKIIVNGKKQIEKKYNGRDIKNNSVPDEDAIGTKFHARNQTEIKTPNWILR